MIFITDTLSLVKFDTRNLAIIKGHEPKDEKKGWGNRVISYYGSIQSAYKAVLNHQIIGGAEGVEATEVLNAIDELNKRLDELDLPTMIALLNSVDEVVARTATTSKVYSTNHNSLCPYCTVTNTIGKENE